MVKKSESGFRTKQHKNRIKADVIILGCSLPGIVTAHKLKKRFGSSMDIIVLNLIGQTRKQSRYNVAFEEDNDDELQLEEDPQEKNVNKTTIKQISDNVARFYLAKYAKEFNIPLPDAIFAPQKLKPTLTTQSSTTSTSSSTTSMSAIPLHKVFQHHNGSTVECVTGYNDFEYLGFMEKFELSQYQTLLNHYMKELFQSQHINLDSQRRTLMYYDQTTMERHICQALFFTTSRDIMRTTVRLVCGAPASNVSVLFYLHQCYRTNSARNHLDGDNTRFREKLLGYCRKRLALKLQQSVADITTAVNHIKEIRTSSNEYVIVETVKGGATYVCTLLAMALKPNELNKINLAKNLISEENHKIASNMVPGHAKKFIIQYDTNFWRIQGYSGDILSIRGPIIWAMERPKMSTTGSKDRYAALMGYLMVQDRQIDNSKEAVLEQLVKLFGEEAAKPASYKETNVADVFVPHCGDYVALRAMICQDSPKYLEWASLDIFADGDMAAALEAGHTAYLHLLSCLRPQAQTYEDVSSAGVPTILSQGPLRKLAAHVNWVSGIRWSMYITVSIIALRVLKLYMKKT